MAKRRSSVDIAAEQEVLRAQAMELANAEGTDEEVEANLKRSQEMLDSFDELETERKAAIEYEKRVEAVRSIALLPAHRENGDGAAAARPEAPAFVPKVDPFDTDHRSLTKQDVVSRARVVIENEKRVPMTDETRAHLDSLVCRSLDGEDADEQFDGSYVARRILLTENKFYRSAFKKYLRLGSLAQYNRDEGAAIAAYQEHELSRAASENTTTAGGFGVPVKLAA